MLLLISFLIMIHELGHFLAAKAFKIKVNKFGFGLPVGPTLYRKKIGDTEFLVHALLLGGYVAFPDDDRDSELEKDSPERFLNKPIYQRMIVVIAGVLSNFIAAFLIVLLTAGIWHKLPTGTFETTIEEVLPTATESVKAANFQKGDVIITVNGTSTAIPTVLTKYLYYSRPFDGFADKKLADFKRYELEKINPNIDSSKILDKGTIVNIPDFLDESPVFLSYDQIIGLDNYKSEDTELTYTQKAVRDQVYGKKQYKIRIPMTLEDLAWAIADTKKPVEIIIGRNGEEIKMPVIYPDNNGLMGIKKEVTEVMYPCKNFADCWKYSWTYIKTNSDLMLYGLGKLFTGKVPMEEMHGIVAITKIGSDIIQYQGLFKGLLLTAIISLNLAYLNLLPIPALDGGHLLFLIIEKIQGKPVDEKLAESIANIFFYLLILLMFYIIFNDIVALITNKI